MIKKNKRLLFLICWLAYFSIYITRLNFSAVMPSIMQNSDLSLINLSTIASGFFFCYAIGQLINGFVGDKINSILMIALGLTLSGITNVLMFTFPFYLPMLFFWSINGLVQSLVWAPMIKLAGEIYEKDEKLSFCANIASTVPVGTIGSYLITMFTVKFLHYRFVFLFCGLVVLFSSFIWISFAPKIVGKLNKVSEDIEKKSASTKSMIHNFIISGVCLAFIAIFIHGALKDGISTWLPTLINSGFSIKTEYAILITMVITLLNLSGAYIAKFINLRTKNEFKTIMIMFTICLVSLGVMRLWSNKYIIILLLAICSVSMSSVNTLVASYLPMKFIHLNRSSSIAGIVNAIIYLGSSAFNFVAGFVVNKFNWNGLIVLWLVITCIALIISLISIKKWKNYEDVQQKG